MDFGGLGVEAAADKLADVGAKPFCPLVPREEKISMAERMATAGYATSVLPYLFKNIPSAFARKLQSARTARAPLRPLAGTMPGKADGPRAPRSKTGIRSVPRKPGGA